MNRLFLSTIAAVAAIGGSLVLLAAPADAQQPYYYGSQLMTPEEWARHRATLESLPPAEREAYRAQHHEQMRQRAEAMGLTLPSQPPPVGRGMGPGMGRGMGPGYGWSSPGPWGPGYGLGAGRPGWGPGMGGPGGRRGGGW